LTNQEIQKVRENDPETIYMIGEEYYKEYEHDEALSWFHDAALQNYPEAQAQIGLMYQGGEGVYTDYKEAMKWYQEAASSGSANGQYYIAELYYYGLGVQQDYEQAMDWLLKAANNGNIGAMIMIGVMYYYGYGVTRNIHTVIEWKTKAANQGDAWAQYSLGNSYYYEDEVKNLQKAVNWYQKAADNNQYGAKDKVEHLNAQGYYAKEDEQEGNID
jgi:TPR repeat protein